MVLKPILKTQKDLVTTGNGEMIKNQEMEL
jgi:hypothetical protein